MIYTNTIILMVIAFILGFMSSYALKNKEHLINLDDSRKVEFSKCCADEKCYSKPPHLRQNCQENKEEAFKKLESIFTEMYSQEEYYKKLEELNLVKDNSNFQRDIAYMNKFNEQIKLGKIDDITFMKVRLDDRDEVKGYDARN